MKRLAGSALLVLMVACATSCEQESKKERNPIQPSAKEITIQSEGGTGEIKTNGGNWRISGVYLPDGTPLYDRDDQLYLGGLGTFYFSWFKIIREEKTTLKIDADEYFSEDNGRRVIIELRDGDFSERISIRQMMSQGFEFNGMEYSIEEGDGDLLVYNSYDFQTVTFRNLSTTDLHTGFYPYRHLRDLSYFTSDDEAAFAWLLEDEDSTVVNVPVSIDGNTPPVGEKPDYYRKAKNVRPAALSDFLIPLTVPGLKKMRITGTIIYRERTVTYTLVLTSHRTGTQRRIKGKWTEIVPVDCLTKQSIEDLPGNH